MKILYRFRLNPDGSIETQPIDNYEDAWGDRYKWQGTFCVCWVKKKNLDKMFCNAVYTFNPDVNYARNIIINSLNDKANNLQKELDKVRDMIDKIKVAKRY